MTDMATPRGAITTLEIALRSYKPTTRNLSGEDRQLSGWRRDNLFKLAATPPRQSEPGIFADRSSSHSGGSGLLVEWKPIRVLRPGRSNLIARTVQPHPSDWRAQRRGRRCVALKRRSSWVHQRKRSIQISTVVSRCSFHGIVTEKMTRRALAGFGWCNLPRALGLVRNLFLG